MIERDKVREYSEQVKRQNANYEIFTGGLLLLAASVIVLFMTLLAILPSKLAFYYAVLFFVVMSLLLILGITLTLIVAFRVTNKQKELEQQE